MTSERRYVNKNGDKVGEKFICPRCFIEHPKDEILVYGKTIKEIGESLSKLEEFEQGLRPLGVDMEVTEAIHSRLSGKEEK